MSTLILVCDEPVSHGTFSSVNSAGPSIDMLDIDRMFPCEKQSICLNSLNVFSWSHMLNRATLPSTTASRSNPPTAENKVFITIPWNHCEQAQPFVSLIEHCKSLFPLFKNPFDWSACFTPVSQSYFAYYHTQKCHSYSITPIKFYSLCAVYPFFAKLLAVNIGEHFYYRLWFMLYRKTFPGNLDHVGEQEIRLD